MSEKSSLLRSPFSCAVSIRASLALGGARRRGRRRREAHAPELVSRGRGTRETW